MMASLKTDPDILKKMEVVSGYKGEGVNKKAYLGSCRRWIRIRGPLTLDLLSQGRSLQAKLDPWKPKCSQA